MNLLLDVNIVIDICTPRLKWYEPAAQVLEKCKNQ